MLWQGGSRKQMPFIYYEQDPTAREFTLSDFTRWKSGFEREPHVFCSDPGTTGNYKETLVPLPFEKDMVAILISIFVSSQNNCFS